MKKVFLLLCVLIIATPILLGGYLGLIPGVSAIFGSDKPRDLGIKTNPEILRTANSKTKTEIANLPANTSIDQSLRYEGSHPIDTTFSSEEITAMVNNSRWKYNPLSQVQVKINPDGSGEASGYIDFNAALQYATSFGVSTDDIDMALKKYPIPRTKFPFYIKATGSVTHNQLTAQVQKLELARIPVPSGIVGEYLSEALNFVEDKYLNSPSLSVTKLENQSGKIYFQGSVPDKELTLQ